MLTINLLQIFVILPFFVYSLFQYQFVFLIYLFSFFKANLVFPTHISHTRLYLIIYANRWSHVNH